MSNLNSETASPTLTVFEDPVAFLSAFGIEAELISEHIPADGLDIHDSDVSTPPGLAAAA